MLTPKQEAFAAAYIELGNASEAYRKAYRANKMSPGCIHVKACLNLKNDKIRVRISDLQRENARRNEITVDRLSGMLTNAYNLSMAGSHPAAAVAAAMGLAKLHGYLNEGGGRDRVELRDIRITRRIIRANGEVVGIKSMQLPQLT